jgi:anti-anti-sigma regulatory factor
MNEHAQDEYLRARPPKNQRVSGGGYHHAPRKDDVVVDLSGVLELDVTSLGLLLTAQQQAETEGRCVWLAGLHVQLWQALDAMGLGRLFKAFPIAHKAAV